VSMWWTVYNVVECNVMYIVYVMKGNVMECNVMYINIGTLDFKGILSV